MILAPRYNEHDPDPLDDFLRGKKEEELTELSQTFWDEGIGLMFQRFAVVAGICVIALAVWKQATRARGGEGGGLPAMIKGIVPSLIGAFLLIQISWVWDTVVMDWAKRLIGAIADTISSILSG